MGERERQLALDAFHFLSGLSRMFSVIVVKNRSMFFFQSFFVFMLSDVFMLNVSLREREREKEPEAFIELLSLLQFNRVFFL